MDWKLITKSFSSEYALRGTPHLSKVHTTQVFKVNHAKLQEIAFVCFISNQRPWLSITPIWKQNIDFARLNSYAVCFIFFVGKLFLLRRVCGHESKHTTTAHNQKLTVAGTWCFCTKCVYVNQNTNSSIYKKGLDNNSKTFSSFPTRVAPISNPFLETEWYYCICAWLYSEVLPFLKEDMSKNLMFWKVYPTFVVCMIDF